MSLLMDALKKAEQAKQQGKAADAPPAPGPAAPPAETKPLAPDPAASALPDLPPKLELLDDEFMVQAKAQATPRSAEPPSLAPVAKTVPPGPQAATGGVKATARDVAAQNTAKNVFTAKRPANSISKPFIITVGSLTLVAVVGIGIYFWLQLRPVGGVGALTAPAAGTLPPPRPAPIMAAALPPAAPPPAAAPAMTVPPMAAQTEPAKPPVAEVSRPPEPRQQAPQAAPDTPIRITSSRLKLNPALAQGFDAFTTGNLTAARSSYEQALKADPRSSDALHGLAAIALREGKPDLAENYYLRALEADPKDAVALAGLMGLKGPGDPVATESRLKTLIAAQPELPSLQFALGNVLARQGRWTEAQQAYFQAFTGEPDNADYAFNLAVSLDQLRQGKLAVQYYNQALSLAATRPAGFDKAQVGIRLRELQQQP